MSACSILYSACPHAVVVVIVELSLKLVEEDMMVVICVRDLKNRLDFNGRFMNVLEV